MKILDTLQFANEKLDIKPMTRSRLAAIPRKPKPILETGDVVKVLVYIRPNDTKTYQLWTYVSYDDFKNYDYNTKLNLYHLKDDAEFKEGAFVFPMVGHGMHIMTVSTFDDNLHYRAQIAGKEVVRQITAIYRGEKKQQPLDSNYFENPTDVGKRCVWEKRNNNMIEEKLDIKPITKSRLDAEKAALSNKPKLLLKTGDIFVSGYSKNIRIYQIFIEEKDFKKWNVKPTDVQDYTQGTFACQNALYGILLNPLSLYDDDLNKPHRRLVEMPFAIYRSSTEIKPPLTKDLVNNLETIVYDNADNLKCVWKSNEIDINEKLDIKPVTKSRLDSVKKSFSKKPKLLLESGDVVVTEYMGNTRRYQIFVAEKDFTDWKVPMPPTKQDCSQGLFFCKNIIYDILAIPVSKYDDNLNINRSTFIEKAVAIYRNRDIINPPITSTLLILLVDKIDNLRCVWKADGANINEKLDIRPVTKDRLSKMKEEPAVDEKARQFIEENNLVWNPKTMSYDCEYSIEISEDIVTDGKLKIRFGKVGGDFNCHKIKLATLEGAPKEVGGYFDCGFNNLTTLEGAPQEVVGRFDCRNNKLTSLEGAPQNVGEDFYCNTNNLTTLKGTPQKVGGSFYCEWNKLTSLEGAPNVVVWHFDCSNNNLTTLKGAPKDVGGDFNCSMNKLTTIEGAPQKVGWHFDCSHNKLVTLEGAPQEVGGNFNCSYNELTTLEGVPKKIGEDFDCYNNNLTTLEGAPKNVSGGFDCDDNNLKTLEGAPQKVEGFFVCKYNELASLKGAPKKVGGNFNCSDNSLTSLEGAPSVVGGYFDCKYNELTSLECATQKVGGVFNCSYNSLTSLEGAPSVVDGNFICSRNSLTSLEGAPNEVGGNFVCSDNPNLVLPEDKPSWLKGNIIN